MVHQPNWCTGCISAFWTIRWRDNGPNYVISCTTSFLQKHPYSLLHLTHTPQHSPINKSVDLIFWPKHKNGHIIWTECLVSVPFWPSSLSWWDRWYKINVEYVFEIWFYFYILKLKYSIWGKSICGTDVWGRARVTKLYNTIQFQ